MQSHIRKVYACLAVDAGGQYYIVIFSNMNTLMGRRTNQKKKEFRKQTKKKNIKF